jgi:hypothetical protein
MLNVTQGMLVEYALAVPPLVLAFEFNPKTLSRTRSVTINTGTTPGTRGGYDFTLPTETPRVTQGVSVEPETFSLQILLDATDRMDQDEPVAREFGVQPELDTLRTLVEPKSQGPLGVQTLASLGFGQARAFQRDETPSVLLFVWGSHILPVFLTSVQLEEVAHMPNLVPYRANVTLNMRVIEGNNPFYRVEKVRQVIGAARNTHRSTGQTLGGLF